MIELTRNNDIQEINNLKEKENCLKVTQAEINSLIKEKKTGELVDPPPNEKFMRKEN